MGSISSGGEIPDLKADIARLRARYVMARAGDNRKLMKQLERQISELENKIKKPGGLR